MTKLIDRLIQQLDTLVPFLALAHNEVFELIHHENEEWFPPKQKSTLPDTFNSYQTQIAHSAFLLGYSYFEAFIADLTKEIFRNRPSLLPGNKELKFSDILDLSDYDSIISSMIDKQVVSILYGSLEAVSEYFRNKLKIDWPSNDGTPSFVEASLVRNCIMHNGATVDMRLGKLSEWVEGEPIVLSPEMVHEYGIELRTLAYSVYRESEQKHFNQHDQTPTNG